MSLVIGVLVMAGLVLVYFLLAKRMNIGLIPFQDNTPPPYRQKYYDSSVTRVEMINSLNQNREMFRSNELPRSMPKELVNNQKIALKNTFRSNGIKSVNYPVDERQVFDYDQEKGIVSERVAVRTEDSVKKATVNYNLKTGYVTVQKDVKGEGGE